jgi:hypothetical protein
MENKTDKEILDISRMLAEIDEIEHIKQIFIRVSRTYDGGIIKIQGVVYKLKYVPLSVYQKYENDYLYKGEVTYHVSTDDEYPILKKTLDYYKNHILK